MELNCPNCGAPLKRDAPYCEYCGTINQGYQQKYDVAETIGGAKIHFPTSFSELYSSLFGLENQLNAHSKTNVCELQNTFALHEELNCLFRISCLQQTIEEQRQELANREYEAAMQEQFNSLFAKKFAQKYQKAERLATEVQNIREKMPVPAYKGSNLDIQIARKIVQEYQAEKDAKPQKYPVGKKKFWIFLFCALFSFIAAIAVGALALKNGLADSVGLLLLIPFCLASVIFKNKAFESW